MAKNDYDVIVVGGGGAGLAAANAAVDAGAQVLILEAAEKLGGSTSLSQGAFYAAGTSVQQALGYPNDSAEDMFNYGMALNQYRMQSNLLKRLCGEAAANLEWLISLGVHFPKEMLLCGGVEGGLPRSHFSSDQGKGITDALEANLQGRGVDIALQTRVRELFVEQGIVKGVVVAGEVVKATAVVIATGGFGANPEMVSRYYPEAASHGDWTWYIGSRHCVGDGLELGNSVGAGLTGFNKGLLLATARFRKEVELPPAWLLFVNRDGQRFMDESAAYGVMSGVIEKQRNSECFAVLDDTAFKSPPLDPRFADWIKEGVSQTSWTAEVLGEYLSNSRIFQGETLCDLALQAGIVPHALEHTVSEYNRLISKGKDDQFYKDTSLLLPISKPPFYGVRLRSSILCFTSTGLRIDVDARVLDVAGRPIPGLYAAGETAGGVMGERYLGSGNSIAHVITYGRIAGRSAAKEAVKS